MELATEKQGQKKRWGDGGRNPLHTLQSPFKSLFIQKVLGESYKIINSAREEHFYFNCLHLRNTLHICSRFQIMVLNMNESEKQKNPEARKSNQWASDRAPQSLQSPRQDLVTKPGRSPSLLLSVFSLRMAAPPWTPLSFTSDDIRAGPIIFLCNWLVWATDHRKVLGSHFIHFQKH